MNRVDGVWAATGMDTEATNGAAAGGAPREVIEAVLSWRDVRGDNALGRVEARAGGAVTIGEGCELLVPADVLGYERFEVARFDGGRAVAKVPAGGQLRVDGWAREEREIEIAAGHWVEVIVGAFVVRMERVHAGTKPAGAPLESLKRSGAGIVLASALAHAAAFAILAYVSPALGATEDDAYDPDRVMLMQKLLDAAAERETPPPPPENGDASSAEGGQAAAQPAQGREGQAGKDTPKRDGRWAARGTARPEDATLARESIKAMAGDFGVIGLLASMQDGTNAPTVTWGTVLNGADDVNRVGHLFGATIDDAMGTGGWGNFDAGGLGGGGTAQMIGLGDGIGVLGGTGSCAGGGKCEGGIGHGGARLASAHVSRFRGPRYGNPVASGHLPPEVIQRIVRQNDGRYRFCYQQAVQTNPTLSGRVTVKFLISRDGSVGYVADGGSDIPDPGVAKCVVQSFANLSFPAPESGVVTVLYPLVFNPE